MSEAASVGKIYKAIIECKRRVGAIAKKGKAPERAGGYDYRRFDDVANAVSPLLDEFGIIVSPRVTKCEHKVDGSKRFTYVEVEFEWIAEDGSRIVSGTVGEAFDVADKSSTKAQTVAYRTVLCQVLNISFDDMKDPEADDNGEWLNANNTVKRILSDLRAADSLDTLRGIVRHIAKDGGLTVDQIKLTAPECLAAAKRLGMSVEQVGELDAYLIRAINKSNGTAEPPRAEVVKLTSAEIGSQLEAAGMDIPRREAAIVVFLRSFRLAHIDDGEVQGLLKRYFPETTDDGDIAGFLVQAIHFSGGPDELNSQSEVLHTARQQSRIGKEVYEEISRYCQYRKSELEGDQK